MTVDVKGSSPLWLKVKDLAEGMTYRFRIRAKTFTYGPEIEANVTTGPGEGRGALGGRGGGRPHTRPPRSERGIQSVPGGAELSKTGSLVELSGPRGLQGSTMGWAWGEGWRRTRGHLKGGHP